jgi:hypothetical protein
MPEKTLKTTHNDTKAYTCVYKRRSSQGSPKRGESLKLPKPAKLPPLYPIAKPKFQFCYSYIKRGGSRERECPRFTREGVPKVHERGSALSNSPTNQSVTPSRHKPRNSFPLGDQNTPQGNPEISKKKQARRV